MFGLFKKKCSSNLGLHLVAELALQKIMWIYSASHRENFLLQLKKALDSGFISPLSFTICP
jgi:hypothetical protein